MTTTNLVQPLKEGYTVRAADYIESIGVQLDKYLNKVGDLEAERAEHKNRLKEIDSEIEKYSGLRHALNRIVRRFARFAIRRKDDFLNGTVRTIKTSSGSFSWRLHSKDTLVYEAGMEHKVALELIKHDRLDLLDFKLKKDPIKEALERGELPNFKSASVQRGETFVIAPTGMRPISLCQDGTIKIRGEKK
ncbi:MAG: hypothetical protein KW788_02865 [Candidatus Doudnabacteria bacterium]|nr:hypothetical protein [Candidatus Doudnabacteria bacterium]